MRTPLHHICNREFIEELDELFGRDVLLLMIDGTAVFGRVGEIEDCVVYILPSIGFTGYYASPFVQILPPNSDLETPLLASELIVDACDIAHIVEGPFVTSPFVFDSFTNGCTPEKRGTPSTAVNLRPQCELIDELEKLEGQNIGIVTLGGWVIAGQLGEVEDCVGLFSPGTALFPPIITLGATQIFGPAFPVGFIVLVGSFRVWSNLKALTQVILP